MARRESSIQYIESNVPLPIVFAWKIENDRDGVVFVQSVFSLDKPNIHVKDEGFEKHDHLRSDEHFLSRQLIHETNAIFEHSIHPWNH